MMTEEEKERLERIKRDRTQGWMITSPDVDFLLELLARLEAL